ncbi:MAG: hypothetical protein OQK48_08495 [Sulfurimonas sp.]|uniref:hypothetical protein n=1 Tax=Sulfurimonas sp. TaxID=2022749 RepID=UPI00260292E7|nr:hypothetical protein [Sulfurimonas sp.]MCW8895971.1 hypothetical protein [Sulfurimonas sp.]MCW8954968.1 hypothetical protein [Sulfurimonas sp.]MCW9067020.1 hypothetical protein [Sulfurimonas sp.]
MQFNTSTIMMIFFILLLIVSIWKIYAFLPNKPLADDDTTQESQDELMNLMLKVIKENHGAVDVNELLVKMETDEDFNSERFWRFNLNKLNQLLNSYYIKNPNAKSISDIYQDLK